MCFSTFLPLPWHVLWPVNWSLVRTWSFYQLTTKTQGLPVNLLLLNKKKKWSVSSAQWVALIGSAHISHLSIGSCDGPRTDQWNLALATGFANDCWMKRNVLDQIGYQNLWLMFSKLLLLLQCKWFVLLKHTVLSFGPFRRETKVQMYFSNVIYLFICYVCIHFSSGSCVCCILGTVLLLNSFDVFIFCLFLICEPDLIFFVCSVFFKLSLNFHNRF